MAHLSDYLLYHANKDAEIYEGKDVALQVLPDQSVLYTYQANSDAVCTFTLFSEVGESFQKLYKKLFKHHNLKTFTMPNEPNDFICFTVGTDDNNADDAALLWGKFLPFGTAVEVTTVMKQKHYYLSGKFAGYTSMTKYSLDDLKKEIESNFKGVK